MSEIPINPSIVIPRSLLEIKTPQLIGIACGVLVFITTIAVVFYLFYKSGSVERLKKELDGSSEKMADNVENVVAPTAATPELYDHLLAASMTLPVRPAPPIMLGKRVVLRVFRVTDTPEIVAICDGSALFGESAYDPVRLFGWFSGDNAAKLPTTPAASRDIAARIVEELYCKTTTTSTGRGGGLSKRSNHAVLIDPELRKPIGMISFIANEPENLSIRIGNLWVTPYYQHKKVTHEAVFLSLQWLFRIGYRRVVVEADTRHVIYRKFLERCGFRLEAVLRKHKILRKRNKDTALYVMLNSEFPEVEVAFKKLLGIPLRVKVEKAADIPNISLLANPPRPALTAADFEVDEMSHIVTNRPSREPEVATTRMEPMTTVVGIVAIIDAAAAVANQEASLAELLFDPLDFSPTISHAAKKLSLVGVSFYSTAICFFRLIILRAGVGIRKKYLVITSIDLYTVGMYLSPLALEYAAVWRRSGGGSALADELIPVGSAHNISDYDLTKLAEISSNGESAPAYIVVTLKFAQALDHSNVYFTIFGQYLSDVLAGCSQPAIDKFSKCLLKAIGRRPKAFDDISFIWYESKGLSIARGDAIGEEMLDIDVSNRLLDFFVNTSRSLIPDLHKSLSSTLSR